MDPLILASTSPFRRELLARLGLPFEVVSPGYAETALPGVSVRELALRHAVGKAHSVSERFRDRVVIGSDQAADLGGAALGKPGTLAGAVAQLSRLSGKRVAFHTGLAVVRGGQVETAVETYRVQVRTLSPEEIETYVAVERPLDSAGAFRIEGLGIALMEGLEGRDYTALIGLPLIALTDLLGRFGIRVLSPETQGLRNSGALSSGPAR
jgi:septum formation protein